ncbi:MAG: LamG-like jellyroll fold domain-containing protein [Victivallaceae bacterium]|jgi:hypothetical protein
MRELNGLLPGCFIVIISCFSLFADQPHLQRSGTNLVTNPDISGSTNWVIRNGMYDSSVSRDAGTGSFKMTIPYPTTNYSYIESALIPVTPGKTYTLSYYMRSDIFPPAGPSLYLGYYNSSQVFVRNSPGSDQSVTASGSWQECVCLLRPQPGEVYVKVKNYFMFQPLGYAGSVWIDNFYLGEGIGFEQAPTAKTPFSGAVTKVDELGNVEIYKNGAWCPFFPIGIYADNRRADWTVYSAQGFNTQMWASAYDAIQRAKDATSTFNPDGMMSGFQIANYTNTGGADYGNLTLLTARINEIKNNNLMGSLLWYYWDNENSYSEWDNPLSVINKIKELDVDAGSNRMHPVYALEGNEGIARKYNCGNVVMTDITGDYITQDTAASYPDETRGALGIVTLWNVEQQKNPVVTAQLNHGVGMLFRPRVFTAIAKGAKAIGFWKDDIDGGSQSSDAVPIENQPWWNDLPNIRREIDQLLPVIRMPHWTSWSLSSNNSLIDFGARDYQGDGYIIATNEQSTAQSVTFTISGLPYTATAARNFFTNEIEAQIVSNQFTVSIPAYGSKVYVLENNIENMLTLKLLCNENGGTAACDASVFASNGTLYGNAALSGGVLSLDGSGDYADCGNKSTLEMGKLDLSIVARVKISTSQSGTYAGIVSKGAASLSPSEIGYSFVYRTDTQKMVLVLCDGSSRPFLTAPTAFNLKDNAWHTVGVSLTRGGNAEFYVDGVSKGTVSASSMASADITNTAKNLTVGCWAAGNYLNGQMDNIRIYKKALSATEMSDLSGNIILDMQFNETSGNPFDSGIYSNNGTLLNGALLGNDVLTLDGTNDRVGCGHDSSLEMGSNDMTIIAKVKLDASQGTYAGIVTKGAGSPADAGYGLVYYNGALIFMISNGTTRLWLSSNSNLGLNDAAWHTVGVSVTRSGNAVFYVDGNSAGSASASSLAGANISNAAHDLMIGSWIDSWPLRGQIDSILVCKRALTAQEILDRR